MNVTRMVRISKKLYQVGMYEASKIIICKVTQYYLERYWRWAVKNRKAHTEWQFFLTKNLFTDNGNMFKNNIAERQFINSTHVLKENIKKKDVLKQADQFCKNVFDLLGSGEQTCAKIPWHTDIRLQNSNPNNDSVFDSISFYKDVQIQSGTTNQLKKDIKLPWELSRANHLFVLGYAYQLSSSSKYVKACLEHIADWIKSNPFMQGVNWVCPMDVGLRAINWIWAWELIKTDRLVDTVFLEQFICSLYDHVIYLEHNWELYDGRTSNHYLSDLVGYLYLCYFFQDLPGFQEKTNWVYNELIIELEKQVFDEGADYEGSTQYHRLVTELYYHVYLMSTHLGYTLSGSVVKKIQNMITFIMWCTPQNGRLIVLGDHDSGKVLYYGAIKNLQKCAQISSSEIVKSYPLFGLAIVKTEHMHVSLKDHVYNARQPSGHIHNDALSFTLDFFGHEIFVDPGSYVYTPSGYWRNHFRSAFVHNTFFLEGLEPVALDERLFFLDVPESSGSCLVTQKQEAFILEAYHDLYKRYGLRAHRKLTINPEALQVTVQDWWERSGNLKLDSDVRWLWNYTMAPECRVDFDSHYGQIIKNNQTLSFTSSCSLKLINGFVSRGYGSKEETKQIRMAQKLAVDTVVTTVIQHHENL